MAASLTANDALPLVRARAISAIPPGEQVTRFPGAQVLYDHSHKLWDAEMDAYMALSQLGFHEAAACAWERRTAASNLTMILSAAL